MWELKKKKSFELQTPLMKAGKLGGRAGVGDHEFGFGYVELKTENISRTCRLSGPNSGWRCSRAQSSLSRDSGRDEKGEGSLH